MGRGQATATKFSMGAGIRGRGASAQADESYSDAVRIIELAARERRGVSIDIGGEGRTRTISIHPRRVSRAQRPGGSGIDVRASEGKYFFTYSSLEAASLL